MKVFDWRLARYAERASWTFGLVGLLLWGGVHLAVARSSQQDLERFAARQAAGADQPPDQTLWSPHRVAAWRKAISESFPEPIAVLRIPKLRLEVAVLPGTDDRTLDRGLGHIEDTASPGSDGNSGIAGHRDGFFRGLKDIMPGDTIEVATHEATHHYRVERSWVVEPDDVSVLDPTPAAALTLVTCYPFYFIGSAPQRFIVRAVRIDDERHVSPVTTDGPASPVRTVAAFQSPRS